jgi:hypothetical protein
MRARRRGCGCAYADVIEAKDPCARGFKSEHELPIAVHCLIPSGPESERQSFILRFGAIRKNFASSGGYAGQL